ncbi:MAG: hypothetical protein ABIV06_03815 [Thermoanaerobaculia bacterium]
MAGVALACGVVILRFVDLDAVKPFQRFYLDVHNGQAEALVLEELDRHFPVHGRFARPVVSRGSTNDILVFTLDPNVGAFDSEFIYVFLEGGTARRKAYEGD